MEKTELLNWINARTDHATYTDAALLRLMEFTKAVPDLGHIVEIGVYGGRTSSIYLWETTKRRIAVSLIDSWVLNESDAKPAFEALAQQIPCSYASYWMQSKKAAALIGPIDLLHIDGDHDQGAWEDCELYLPKVNPGGIAVVHDYGDDHGSYPEVIKAVDHYFAKGWELLEVVGSQFAARKL